MNKFLILVSENKVLCHPASIDSLSTSAGTEDHVSMGGFAARKVLQVVENVERVIAIELLAACQAIEFLRPLKTTDPLEEVYNLVRSVAKSVIYSFHSEITEYLFDLIIYLIDLGTAIVSWHLILMLSLIY